MQKFNDNSRVCFLGDSITSAGIWIAKIFEYYKNKGVSARFYNLGVAGNTAQLQLEYLEDEPFLKDATDVVMSFGMNDIGRRFYETGGNFAEKASAIERSKQCLGRISEKLLAEGKSLILCSSTPHGEDNDINTALCEIGSYMKELAKNAGVSYIDFHKLFTGVMKHTSLVDDDKVHPNLMGNAVLANVFLSLQGFDDVYTGTDKSVWEKEMHFEMCGENVLRFKTEATLRSIAFVKRIVLPGCKGDESEFLDKYYETCDAFFKKQINVYRRNKTDENKLMDKLVLYTEKLALNDKVL